MPITNPIDLFPIPNSTNESIRYLEGDQLKQFDIYTVLPWVANPTTPYNEIGSISDPSIINDYFQLTSVADQVQTRVHIKDRGENPRPKTIVAPSLTRVFTRDQSIVPLYEILPKVHFGLPGQLFYSYSEAKVSELVAGLNDYALRILINHTPFQVDLRLNQDNVPTSINGVAIPTNSSLNWGALLGMVHAIDLAIFAWLKYHNSINQLPRNWDQRIDFIFGDDKFSLNAPSGVPFFMSANSLSRDLNTRPIIPNDYPDYDSLTQQLENLAKLISDNRTGENSILGPYQRIIYLPLDN